LIMLSWSRKIMLCSIFTIYWVARVSTGKEAGFHSIRWDATNDAGAPVSAGLYMYMIKARRLQTNEEDGTVEVAFL